MTILDFYKNLSKILTDTREGFLSQKQGQTKLNLLLEEAKSSNLQVNINPQILDPINLMRLDDEKSFTSNDDDDDFSYDSPYETSF